MNLQNINTYSPSLMVAWLLYDHVKTYSYNYSGFPPFLPYMRYLTLYYQIGFASDDFVQLLASERVLSTFEAGQAKLWCLIG
jgi:hypothetical protein